MKYKLLQNIPGAKEGEIIDNIAKYGSMIDMSAYPDFFEPIVEIKSVHDLKKGDRPFYIDCDGTIYDTFYSDVDSRSQTFLTREEAEDEHKRREWAVRKNKFFPKEGELYYTQWRDTGDIEKFKMTNDYIDNFIINSGLAFRSESECQDAIDNHDIIRLFYDVR